MNKANTAWAFLVVSDPQQADTLPDQEAWAREAAHAHGWVITRTISGVSSGKSGARGLTVSMIADLERLAPPERPQRILMIRLERFGRGDGTEAMEVFLKVRKMGIVVHTRLDGDVGYGRASELLMPVLRFFVGGMENEVRRDKLNAMYERRRIAQRDDPTIAISSKVPYGLKYERGHYVPKPPEDEAVRLAYELKGQGYGSHLIAKRLAVVASEHTLKNGHAYYQKWTADRVRKLLMKSSYRGVLVSEETWLRAQRAAKEIQRPTRRFEYPFGGSLRCECGYALFGNKGTGHYNCTFHYYVCRNTDAHNGRFRHYRSDRIEQHFLDLLHRLAVDDDLVRRFLNLDEPGKGEALQAQLATIRNELSGIDSRRRAIFKAFEDGSLAQADLQWRLDDLSQHAIDLERRIVQLESEIATARASTRSFAEVHELVTSAAALWTNAGIEDKRALTKAMSKAFGLIVRSTGALVLGQPAALPVRSPKHLQTAENALLTGHGAR